MFVDYLSLVLDSYKRIIATNDSPPRLKEPSPANLRDECFAMCKARYSRKDEKILMTFFGPHNDKADYLEAIEQFNINKFKPLQNFLLGESTSTDIKNIELLAWLIDFPDRPYDLGKKYRTEEADEAAIRTTEPEVDNSIELPAKPDSSPLVSEISEADISAPPPSPTPVPARAGDTAGASKKGIKFGPRQTLAAATVLVGISMAFWFGGNKGDGGCMYWAGDRYQAIPCTEKIKNVLIVALDTVKVNHFRRITLEDTITRNAIGGVWYSKINNEIEYFTSDGYHPVVTGRKLKPLSRWIYDKYLDSLMKPH